MIKLTKFNSKTNKKGEFVLNAEIIETIEETPDTVVTLTNGKKLIVDEPMDEIVRRVMKYRRALHQFYLYIYAYLRQLSLYGRFRRRRLLRNAFGRTIGNRVMEGWIDG